MNVETILAERVRLKKLGVKVHLAHLTVQEGETPGTQEYWLVFKDDKLSDEAYHILDKDGWMPCHAVFQNRDYYTKEIKT